MSAVIDFYRTSVKIGVDRNREQSLLAARDSMIYLLQSLCQDGQVAGLKPALDDFLTHFTDPMPVREFLVESAAFTGRQEECHNAIAGLGHRSGQEGEYQAK